MKIILEDADRRRLVKMIKKISKEYVLEIKEKKFTPKEMASEISNETDHGNAFLDFLVKEAENRALYNFEFHLEKLLREK